jgi:DNA-binding GntR family transcriptional regulator
MAAITEDGNRASGAVSTAVASIRDMIRRGELSPGEPVRQQNMAERLQMSRVPIREALHTLQTEGLLRHDRNRGYFVVKFNADQLRELYLMRALLETALLKHLRWPDEEQIRAIEEINKELARIAELGPIARLAQLNRQFHEAIFNLSPLETVHQEISRLWEMSDSYRALYLAGPARYRTVLEHDEMIEALRAQDLDWLIDCADKHRRASEQAVARMLDMRSAAAAPDAPPAVTELSAETR